MPNISQRDLQLLEQAVSGQEPEPDDRNVFQRGRDAVGEVFATDPNRDLSPHELHNLEAAVTETEPYERTATGQVKAFGTALPRGAMGAVGDIAKGYQVLSDQGRIARGETLDRPTSEGPAYQFGEGLRESGQERFETDPMYQGGVADTLGEATGSFGPFLAGGGIGGAVGRGVAAGARIGERGQRIARTGSQLGTAASMAAPAGAAETYDRGMQWLEQNPDSGLTEDDMRDLATKWGTVAGTVQILSVAPILRHIPAGQNRDQAVAYFLRRVGEAGLSEYTVENAGALIQNLAQQTYDPDHPVWDEIPDRGESAAGAAALLQVLTYPYLRRSRIRGDAQDVTGEDVLAEQEAIEGEFLGRSELPSPAQPPATTPGPDAAEGRTWQFDQSQRQIDAPAPRAEPEGPLGLRAPHQAVAPDGTVMSEQQADQRAEEARRRPRDLGLDEVAGAVQRRAPVEVPQEAPTPGLDAPRMVQTPDGQVGTEAQVDQAARDARQREQDLGLTEVAGARQGRVDGLMEDTSQYSPAQRVDLDALQADIAPTPMGHTRIQGVDVSIETPRGSVRRGTDPDGNAWERELQDHYGYIRRTEGSDGDQVDAFIGPQPDAPQAFVIDQVDPSSGRFDEHKVMLGYPDEATARQAYQRNYEDGWQGLGDITPMPMEEFRGWLRDGDQTRPVSSQADTGLRPRAAQDSTGAEALRDDAQPSEAPQRARPQGQGRGARQGAPRTPQARRKTGEAQEGRPRRRSGEPDRSDYPVRSQAEVDAVEGAIESAGLHDQVSVITDRVRGRSQVVVQGTDDGVRQLAEALRTSDDRGASSMADRLERGASTDPSRNDPNPERLGLYERAREWLGVRVQGSTFAREFLANDFTPLVGARVESMEDLAVVAQVYRNPMFETLRVVYIKNDRVIHQTGLTSRTPTAVQLSTGEDGAGEFFAEIRRAMRSTSADGYYLLHNHPSGIPNPSAADVNVTRLTASEAEGFLGHVVIDQDQYGFITASGRTGTTRRLMPESYQIDNIERDHPALGQRITSPRDLANAFKAVETADGYVSVVVTGKRHGGDPSGGEIKGVMEMPVRYLERPGRAAGILRRFARHVAGHHIFLGNVPRRHRELAETAIERKIIADALIEDGSPASQDASGIGMSPLARESIFPATSMRVEEGTGTYQRGRQTAGEFQYRERPDGRLEVFGAPETIRAALADAGLPAKGRAKTRPEPSLQFSSTAAPRVLRALRGEGTSVSRRGRVTQHERFTGGSRAGQYVGAPPRTATPRRMTALRRKLNRLAQEGEVGRHWYEKSGEAILEFTGQDKAEAERFAKILAIYSQGNAVKPNATNALKAWYQWKSGEPIQAGRFGSQDRRATEVLYEDKAWEGEKTNNFYINLMRQIDPERFGAETQGATIDLWMTRAFGYHTDAPTAAAYRFMETETNRLARDLGWEPQQVQAAIWVAIKARTEDAAVKRQTDQQSERAGYFKWGGERGRERVFQKKLPARHRLSVEKSGRQHRVVNKDGEVIGRGGTEGSAIAAANETLHRDLWFRNAMTAALNPDTLADAKVDFADGMRLHQAMVSWEARPSVTDGTLAGVHSAPIEQQIEFQVAMEAALRDDQGRDMLAQRLGILYGASLLGPGAWQGDVSVATQQEVLVPTRHKPEGEEVGTVEPGAKAIMNAYADLMGLLLRQDGVAWHRPYYAATKKTANGVDVNLGAAISSRDAAAVYDRLIELSQERFGMSEAQAQEFAPITTGYGFRVLNFSAFSELGPVEVSNTDFHKLVFDAAESSLSDEVTFRFDTFRSDGELRENKWQENPDGEGYRQRLEDAGFGDSARWADRVLAGRVQEVRRRFAERYGWDDPLTVRDDTGGYDASDGRRGDRQPEGDERRGRGRARGEVPEQEQGRVDLTGIHFSRVERTHLDGRFYGTGLKGAEARRLANSSDPRIKKRVFAYIDEGQGIAAEGGVGTIPHRVEMDNLYDYMRDPQGIVASQPDANAAESAILDLGFNGLYVRGAMRVQGRQVGVAVMLGDATESVPVQRVETTEGVSEAPAAPERTPLQQVADRVREAPGLPPGSPRGRDWPGHVQRADPELHGVLERLGVFERMDADTRYYASGIADLVLDSPADAPLPGNVDLRRVGGRRPEDITVEETRRGWALSADGVTLSIDRTDPRHHGSDLQASPEARHGTGVATRMYLEALRILQANEQGHISDGIMSDRAQAIYERLIDAGVPYQREYDSGEAVSRFGVSAEALQDVDLNAVQDALDARYADVDLSRAEPLSAVGSDAFSRWFGGSVVVNEDGSPRVMYHGTTAEIRAFDINKIREIDYDAPFNGFWFSSDPSTGPAMRDASNIMPVYLAVTNPAPAEVWRRVAERVQETSETRPEARSFHDEARYQLQDMGYDGVVWDAPLRVDREAFERDGEYTGRNARGRPFTVRREQIPERTFQEITRHYPAVEVVTPDGARQISVQNNTGVMEAIIESVPRDSREQAWAAAINIQYGGQEAATFGDVTIRPGVIEQTQPEMVSTGGMVDVVALYEPVVGRVTDYESVSEFERMHSEHTVVAFRPEQIKSAVGNQGTFDAAAEDVTLRRFIDGSGMDAGEAQATISRLMQGWEMRPEVTAVETESALPEDVRRHIADMGATGEVAGLFHRPDNTIYIVADRMRDAQEVERTVLHEVVGHFGLQHMLGADIAPTLEQVYRAFGRRELQGMIDTYFPDGSFDPSNRLHRLQIAGEMLAHMAETGAKPRLFDRVVAALARWARRMGFTLEMTRAEVRALLRRAREFVEQGEVTRTSADGASDTTPSVFLSRKRENIDFEGMPTIEPRWKEWSRLRGMWDSASDVLRRQPELRDLASRVDRYFDRTRERMGRVNGVIRPAVKQTNRLPRRQRREVYEGFALYQAAKENGREVEARAIYYNGRAELKQLIDTWDRVADMTGTDNQRLGIQVQTAEGQWRPIGKVEGFWPRTLKREVQRALDDPAGNPEMWNRLTDELMAEGYISEPAQASRYISNYFSPVVSSDYFAGVEKARAAPLPEFFYDYSWDAGMRYKERWADRASQIEVFGQKTTPDTRDAFDEAIAQTTDQETQQYIAAIRDRVYNVSWNDPYQRIIGILNQVATAVQLGNPATATLNLVGGSTLNYITYGNRAMLASFKDLARFGRALDEVYEKGILVQDYLQLLHDAQQQGVPERLQRFTSGMLVAGGYTPAETFIRTHGYLISKHFLRDALKHWNSDINSRKSRLYLAWFQRNNFDYRRLVLENGSGEYTDTFYRYAVNLPQGSYRVNQVPIFVDTPIGRFLFKYQKFGTQLSRMFWRQHLKPAIDSIGKGERVYWEEAGREVSGEVRNFVPLLRYMAGMIPAGWLLMALRESLFGYTDPSPGLDEIEKALEDERNARALALTLKKAFDSFLAIGGLGFFGNYYQMGRDVADRQRVKDPLSPPGIAPIEGTGELILRGFEQGRFPYLHDFHDVGQQQFSLYRTTTRLTLRGLHIVDEDIRAGRLDAARRDRSYARKMARRYADEAGIERKRRAPDRIGLTPMSATNREIINSLMVGEAERAHQVMLASLQDAENPREVEQTLQSIRGAVRSAEPARVSLSPSNRERNEFLSWLKDNVGEQNYQRVRRVDREYRRAAARAGLLNIQRPIDQIRDQIEHERATQPFESSADREFYLRRIGIFPELGPDPIMFE